MAALAVPPSTLPQLLPLSLAETSSRLTTDGVFSPEGTADDTPPFTELLAGLVGDTGAADGDNRSTPPDDAGVPDLNALSGLEILLGAAFAPQPAEQELVPAGEGTSSAQDSSGGELVFGVAGSLSGAASGRVVPVEKEAEPEGELDGDADTRQRSVGPNYLAIQSQPPTVPTECPAMQTVPAPVPTEGGEALAVALASGREPVQPMETVPSQASTYPQGIVGSTGQQDQLMASTPAELQGDGAPANPQPAAGTASQSDIGLGESVQTAPGMTAPADPTAPALAGAPSVRETEGKRKCTGVPNAKAIDAKRETGLEEGETVAPATDVAAPVEAAPSLGDSATPVPAQSETPDCSATRAPAGPATASADRMELPARRPGRTPAAPQTTRKPSGSVVAQVLALGGLVPQTVDSMPPVEAARRPGDLAAAPGAAPERAASQSAAEGIVPRGETQVRMMAASTPDRDEIAFAVQMKAMPTPEEPARTEPPPRALATAAFGPRTEPAQDPEPAASEPVENSERRASALEEPERAPARAGRERHAEPVVPELSETLAAAPAAPAGKMILHAAADAQVGREPSAGSPEPIAAKPVRPQDVMETAGKAETSPTHAVRDMKFEVTGGDRRVEVRLSERGGEVKMTVRTPDAHLASALREDLPTLNARLAENGLKSEAWHPAASYTDERRLTAESSAGAASQDASSQHRQQEREPQEGGGHRRPQGPQAPVTRKQKGSDFSWLMSSLR